MVYPKTHQTTLQYTFIIKASSPIIRRQQDQASLLKVKLLRKDSEEGAA